MQIPVNSSMKWKERYAEEVARSVYEYEKKNKEAEVKTRQMTEEERRDMEWITNHENCHRLKLNIGVTTGLNQE